MQDHSSTLLHRPIRPRPSNLRQRASMHHQSLAMAAARKMRSCMERGNIAVDIVEADSIVLRNEGILLPKLPLLVIPNVVTRKHEDRTHSDYAARPHVCQLCGKRFWFPKDLDRHEATHNRPPSRYFCSYNGCEYKTKGFYRRDHFNRHMEAHRRADSAIQMSRTSSSQAWSQM